MKPVRRASTEGRERRAGCLMVAPVVVVLAGVALYPILAAIWLSFHRFILVFHERRFVGWDNYLFMLQDARFWSSLAHTAYFTSVSVAVELVLGMGIALLLQAPSPGRTLLRAGILIPWAIPTVVSAKMWAWLLNQDYGLVARAFPGQGVNWLGTPGYAMSAAILVDVWKTTPFVALLLLAGLVGIPPDVYQAAAIDGASPLQAFIRITLPLLKRTLFITLLFRSLDAFRVFDAIYVLTEGGPGNTTETISVYAYKTLMRTGDFGYGSALSVATLVCVAAISAVYLKLLAMDGRTT